MSQPPHSTRNPRRWQARLIVPAGLLLLTVLYFWPQVIGGRVLYWGDIGLYFAPMQEFLRHTLRQGRLPLWNPLILCGTPYVGNPQTWPLYPVTALLPLMSASAFLNATIALHIWLAGCGTYLFARRALRLRRSAAGLAALTFMFGGQLVSKEQFPNMVQAAAWLPWVLMCLDRLLHRRRLADALWLGTALGLQLLAAHPQMTALTLYLASAWGVFVRMASPKGKGGWGRVAFLLSLSVVTALGLAACQLLPTLGLFHDAARQKLPFFLVNRFFLPLSELGNFVLPRLHGHPYFGDWTGRGNFWETCCYVGWLPFLLGVWGMVSAVRQGGTAPARFWAGVFVVGVWMALGGSGGLYVGAYRFLPGFRSFHDPARCLLWACFALSLLAAYGWEAAYPAGSRKWSQNGRGATALLLLLVFADLAHFGRTLYPLANPAALSPVTPLLAQVQADPDVQAHQARVLAPTPGVWLRFTNYHDFRQTVPGYQDLWADTLTPNMLMPHGVSDAYGYEPVPLKNAQETAGNAAQTFYPQATREQQRQAAALAGALGVKYVAVCRAEASPPGWPGLVPLRAETTLPPPGGQKRPPGVILLARNARWQPRAHLRGSAVPVPLTDDGPDRVILRPVTQGPQTVILADTNAAGWQATVNGVSVPITAAGGSLRAVRLPGSGPQTVVFSYRPALFRLGLYLSLLTLCGLTACMVGNLFGAGKFLGRGGFHAGHAE